MSLKRKRIKQRARRSERVHGKMRAISDRPRLVVFRSLKHFYGQVVDDKTGNVLCACSTLELENLSGDKKVRAKAVGLELAKRALETNIKEVALDRGRFLYHGRVQFFAEGAREGGLTF